MKRAAMIAVAAMALGCGTAKSGDACSGSGGDCADDVTALFCQSGRLASIPCKGEGGCISDGVQVQCNIRAVAGDACLESSEGKAQCDAGDADKALRCTSGTWQSSACHGCYVQNGLVMCQG